MFTDIEIYYMANFSKNSKIINKYIMESKKWKKRLELYPVEWKNSRKLYHYFYMKNSTGTPLCLMCKSSVRFVSYTIGYKMFCSSKCCNTSKQWKDSVKKSNLKKYGVTSVMKLESTKSNLKKSLLEKYGVDNYSKHPNFIDKFKKTFIERYGVESPMHLEMFKNKQKSTFIERYGIDSSNKVSSVKDKKKAAWLKNMDMIIQVKYLILKLKKITL